MMGPEIPLYLTVASFLFATGALGVLLRRNPLIVLLSLEIMLNGVMAVAASEVVVGLGLVVALHRRDLELDVDRLSTLRG
jgi:NADH-quinone oxidoreductase subunit K